MTSYCSSHLKKILLWGSDQLGLHLTIDSSSTLFPHSRHNVNKTFPYQPYQQSYGSDHVISRMKSEEGTNGDYNGVMEINLR